MGSACRTAKIHDRFRLNEHRLESGHQAVARDSVHEVEIIKIVGREIKSAADIVAAKSHRRTLPALCLNRAVSVSDRRAKVGNYLTMIVQYLSQTLMPLRCVFCGDRCRMHEAAVCDGCIEDLPWRESLVTIEKPPLEVSVVLFDYSFPIDAALKALKFRRRIDYVPALAELLWRVSAALPHDIDALLPVPLHWRRHATRGFNQAAELSGLLHKRSRLPLLSNFIRTRPTPFQSGLERDARSRNMTQAFAARGRCDAQHVLIIDDVITTGATVCELARVAIAAGATRVSALAVART
jgi:ComF family protein